MAKTKKVKGPEWRVVCLLKSGHKELHRGPVDETCEWMQSNCHYNADIKAWKTNEGNKLCWLEEVKDDGKKG